MIEETFPIPRKATHVRFTYSKSTGAVFEFYKLAGTSWYKYFDGSWQLMDMPMIGLRGIRSLK